MQILHGSAENFEKFRQQCIQQFEIQQRNDRALAYINRKRKERWAVRSWFLCAALWFITAYILWRW